jgi:hypothetical protein
MKFIVIETFTTMLRC